MSVHPVTPMHEADLARHLGGADRAADRQASTYPALDAGREAIDRELDRAARPTRTARSCSTRATPAQLTEVGRLLERLARGRGRPLFVVGSSGLEYALTQWWRERGDVAPAPRRPMSTPSTRSAGARRLGQRVAR